MAGTVEAPTASSQPKAEVPISTIYSLVPRFNERTRFLSSVADLRRDPAYKLVVAMGEIGAVRVLNYTTGHGPSWLEIAVDEISRQDISGLKDPALLAKGITLADIHERTHAWGESESLIPIRDKKTLIQKGQEALWDLEHVFLSDQAIANAMAEAAFYSERRQDARYRMIDSMITIDRVPAEVQYIRDSGSSPGHPLFSNVDESLHVRKFNPRPGENPTLFFAKTMRSSRGVFHVGFEAGGNYSGTLASSAAIKDLAIHPPKIELISARASFANNTQI